MTWNTMTWSTYNNYCNNIFKGKVICVGWILFQIFIFLYNFNILSNDEELSNIINKLNYSFLISKSSALLININFMLLFICINKSIVSFICNIFSINNYYHIAIFSSIIFFSIIHVVSHIFNYYYLTYNDNDIKILLKTPTSITGMFLIFSMIIIYIFSLKSLRIKTYELFLIMHYLLCGGICICLLVHGSLCFFIKNNGQCLKSSFWKFILIPVILQILERIYREYIGSRYTTVIKVKKHSYDCIDIELYKPFFKFNPGQWVLLNCPDISYFQWHPFTIISNCGDIGHIQLLLKERGKWTKSLSELLLRNVFYKNNINLRISSPYGYNCNIILQYNTVVLIAGGIGITSFISLLKSLKYNLNNAKGKGNPKKICLHWICKNIYDFDCFINELYEIKCNLDELYNNVLELYFYVTGSNKNINMIINNYSPTIEFNNSRPDFNEIFEILYKNNKNNKKDHIKVIICGSNEMYNDIYIITKKYGNKFSIKNLDLY